MKDVAPADRSSIFPNLDQESESVTEHPLHAEPAVPKDAEPLVQKNVESAVPQNVETVGVPNEEAPVVRQRRMPNRFCDDNCLY